ncbi:MAG: AMP-binding protein [Alphaproteobacteria bacterium]|nr:AMP-binding protein [Alphaproteobacteria bacterium]
MINRRIFDKPADWQILRDGFHWNVPKHFNIATACCDSWAAAEPNKVAIIHVKQGGATKTYSFQQLRAGSNALANGFRALGMQKGDRCAVLLAQSPEVMITHFACHKLGMISLPLFTLFGADALEYRLSDSGARVVVTDEENVHKILGIKDKLPALEHIYVVGRAGKDTRDFWLEIGQGSQNFTPVDTLSTDPAIIIYTSGTTGPPKGALHAHEFLLGHLPAVELQHEFFPKPGDVGWTPADWAWVGGLMNIAMVCLYYGVPLISHRMGKFDPEAAYHLIKRQNVKNLFLPPTALKIMRQINAPADLSIRTVMSGGESLGADLLDWGREALGVTINETYGQTECNLCLTSSAGIGVQKPGTIGKPVPGFDVEIIDGDGIKVATGEIGEIAIKRGTPVMFREYWKQPQKTAEKFVGDWLKTGDLGVMDEEGYVTFSSRDDDVITSSGYRIGPTEIENCLTGHPDVALAAAVGIPDPVRTESVKAFIVLRDGAPTAGLEAELIARVRSRISVHVAPRAIEIIDAMPMTATGKIMRKELRARG